MCLLTQKALVLRSTCTWALFWSRSGLQCTTQAQTYGRYVLACVCVCMWVIVYGCVWITCNIKYAYEKKPHTHIYIYIYIYIHMHILQLAVKLVRLCLVLVGTRATQMKQRYNNLYKGVQHRYALCMCMCVCLLCRFVFYYFTLHHTHTHTRSHTQSEDGQSGHHPRRAARTRGNVLTHRYVV
jgi:hypothetical protein